MKLVREHINEKFTQESDPVKDMGIGLDSIIFNYLKKLIPEELSHVNSIKNINKYNFVNCSGFDAIIAKLGMLNKIEIMPLILSFKKVNARANKSFALRWAAANGNSDMIKLLLKYGANPNDSDGGNAVDCAIMYKMNNIVEYLENIGGKPSDVGIKYKRKNKK